MNRTLLALTTHFIDENVISEYRKMKNTPNVDAILAINNTDCKIEFNNRVENKIFFNTSVKCFFFDSKLHDELKLPYFTFAGLENFGRNMWANSDYRFTYIKKFFPNYDYYWTIDYDVFCNAETYAGFLKKFKNNHSDLIIPVFRPEKKNGAWYWSHGTEWIYKDAEIYGSLFAVERISGRAIDFLYQRRLEHKKIFEESNDKDKHWIFCELFTPTELMNGGFSCEKLEEKDITDNKKLYFNDKRIFLEPNDHLYHPVKSVKSEIEKHEKQYADLFLMFKKVYLNQLAEKVIAIKNLSVHFDKDYNFVIFAIPKRGGAADISLRYEARFIQGRIYLELVFEGKYLNQFQILNQCVGLAKIHPIQIFQTPTSRTLAYIAPTLDNVSQVADVMKILIESTYNILMEKIYENN